MNQPPKIKHWEVISHPGSEPCYSWRRIGVDDTILESSGTFETYGSVLVDAIKHGFSPERHHWVKINKQYTIHFGPDRLPVVIPPDRKPPPAPRGAPIISNPEPQAGARPKEKQK